MVLAKRYNTPRGTTEEAALKEALPLYSRTVAYWLLARGQDWRLQSPVKLYSFRQKCCLSSGVLAREGKRQDARAYSILKEQK